MAWYDPDWLYRQRITIDHTLVAEDVAHFPVLITDAVAQASNPGAFAVAGTEEQEGGNGEPPPLAGAGVVVCLFGERANVRRGQQVRPCVDGLHGNMVAGSATGSWSIYRWG